MKHAYPFLVLVGWLLAPLTTTAQVLPTAVNANYSIEQIPRDAATTIPANATPQNTQARIRYFDGMGRPTQTIQRWAGANGVQDVMTDGTEYDFVGRVQSVALPVPANTTGEPLLYPTYFYSGYAFYTDGYMYTEPVYEASPLNRIIKQFAPGSDWRGTTERPQTMQYGTAPATVYRFHITDSQINALVPGTTNTDSYNAKDLSLKTTTNEQGQTTTDYTDLQGRLIRRDVVVSASETLTTVYVYDDLGRLAGVLPPKLMAYFQTTASFLDFTNAVFDELAFVYQYDTRGRQIRKHIPSAGWTELVYDTSDRLVMSRDEQDRAEIKWQFTKYDGLNRPTQTGRMTLNRPATDLRTDFASQTRQAYPTTVSPGLGDLLTQSYYDSYTDVGLSFNPTGAFANPFPDATSPAVRGLPTGGQVRNLENGAWYNVGMWYDERGRVIQQQSQNHLGGTDRTDTRYRFNGEVLETTLRHERTVNGQPLTTVVTTGTDYDHASRPASVSHAIDGDAPTELARYTYDAIGRLVEKATGGNGGGGGPANSQQSGPWTHPGTWQGGNQPTTGASVSLNPTHTVNIPAATRVGAGPLRVGGRLVFGPGSVLRLGPGGGGPRVGPLQTIRYRYHIRGGLEGINTDSNGNPDLSGGSLFSLRLERESAGQYGGNIASQAWATTRDGQTRQYSYSYDGADRLTGAGYSGKPSEDFSLSGLTYDKNGNLLSLTRNGVDQLTYAYTANNTGNRLNAVSDGITGNADVGDFRDTHTGADDYEYYADGSLKKDRNRDIDEIVYNHLKLPRRITFTSGKVVSYTYTAAGQKLRMAVTPAGGGVGEVRDYAGPFQYLNGNLFELQTAEGRYTPATGYEYFHRDHLGNVRVVYRDSLDPAAPAFVSQFSDYDPWGLPLWGGLSGGAGTNRLQFNGKEAVGELGKGLFDFGARGYDAQIGRWGVVDPMAEVYDSYSPFVFGLNNPLRFIDPDGRAITPIEGGVRFTGSDIGPVLQAIQSQEIKAIHFVYENETPQIYRHTLNSFRQGKPEILHYDSDVRQADRRRYQATKPYPSRKNEGLERDEYPYASTKEGGLGAMIAYVDEKENSRQGRDLRRVYRFLQTDDSFLVLPLPKKYEPNPVDVPIIVPALQRSPTLSPEPLLAPFVQRLLNAPLLFLTVPMSIIQNDYLNRPPERKPD